MSRVDGENEEQSMRVQQQPRGRPAEWRVACIIRVDATKPLHRYAVMWPQKYPVTDHVPPFDGVQLSRPGRFIGAPLRQANDLGALGGSVCGDI